MADHPTGDAQRTADQARRRVLLLRSLSALAATAVSSASGGAGAALPTRNEDLPSFDRIVLAVPADVRVAIGDGHGAAITAEQKVIDSIRFHVAGSRLTVSVTRNFQTRQPISITIRCRQLVELHAELSTDARLGPLEGQALALKVQDAATVIAERLNLSALEVDIGGSGTVEATGQAGELKVKVGGAGTYQGENLRSRTARVEADGSSDATVDSREQLDVTVGDAATVSYSGNPRLRQTVRAAGTLERR